MINMLVLTVVGGGHSGHRCGYFQRACRSNGDELSLTLFDMMITTDSLLLLLLLLFVRLLIYHNNISLVVIVLAVFW